MRESEKEREREKKDCSQPSFNNSGVRCSVFMRYLRNNKFKMFVILN